MSLTTVAARTFTPPAVPGATVTYRVKAAYNESGWSNRVSITYAGPVKEPPPEEGGGGGGGEEANRRPKKNRRHRRRRHHRRWVQ